MFTKHDAQDGPPNVEGKKHMKAKHEYNKGTPAKAFPPGVAKSNALKGLKTAAQPNNFPANANSNPPGSNGFPNNSWS